MGRAPCCDKAKVKKGPWSPEEDEKLKEYMEKNGFGGNWIALPEKAGLRRCGKSCRLRWLNYLRPNIKHGEFSDEEERIICSLYANIGSRWSIIAGQLPGRTDNDIKNYWNTKLKKKLIMDIHKNPIQKTTYPPFSLSSTTTSSTYYHPTGYDHQAMATTTTPSNASSVLTLIQAENGYVGPMRNYQKKDNNVLITFGGEEANIGENIELFHGGYVCNNGVDDENVQRLNGCSSSSYGENSLDYSLEEIKQLISTTNTTCNNLNLFF